MRRSRHGGFVERNRAGSVSSECDNQATVNGAMDPPEFFVNPPEVDGYIAAAVDCMVLRVMAFNKETDASKRESIRNAILGGMWLAINMDAGEFDGGEDE